VEAYISGHNKGGLECEVGGLRGFIPVSQVSLYRVDELQSYVGQKIACVVTEADRSKRKLVLSRRAALEREKADAKRKLWESLQVGQTHEGVVRSLQDFGAFVDLGGVDGLIHISQLSWDRVQHPRDVLEVGQKVRVRVEKLDRAQGRIGLAYRDLLANPWTDVERKYPTSSRVQGTVTKIMDIGALVRLEPGISGLVHISELTHRRVWRVSDVVQEGQQVEALVLSVDGKAQRISLSLKALEAKPDPRLAEAEDGPPSQGETPKTPRRGERQPSRLKGGVDRSAGGERFGLRW
jgi:small subunit ribosomal protein S1